MSLTPTEVIQNLHNLKPGISGAASINAIDTLNTHATKNPEFENLLESLATYFPKSEDVAMLALAEPKNVGLTPDNKGLRFLRG